MKMYTQLGIDDDQFRMEVLQRIHIIGISGGVPTKYSYPFQLPPHVLENNFASSAKAPPNLLVDLPQSVTPSPKQPLPGEDGMQSGPPIPRIQRPGPPTPQTLSQYLGNCKNLEKRMYSWSIRKLHTALGNCINTEICMTLDRHLNKAVEETTSMAKGCQGDGIAGFGNLDRRQYDHRHSASSPGRMKKRKTGRFKPTLAKNMDVIDLTVHDDSGSEYGEMPTQAKPTNQKDEHELLINRPPSMKKPPADTTTVTTTRPLSLCLSDSDSSNDDLLYYDFHHPKKKHKRLQK